MKYLTQSLFLGSKKGGGGDARIRRCACIKIKHSILLLDHAAHWWIFVLNIKKCLLRLCEHQGDIYMYMYSIQHLHRVIYTCICTPSNIYTGWYIHVYVLHPTFTQGDIYMYMYSIQHLHNWSVTGTALYWFKKFFLKGLRFLVLCVTLRMSSWQLVRFLFDQ